MALQEITRVGVVGGRHVHLDFRDAVRQIDEHQDFLFALLDLLCRDSIELIGVYRRYPHFHIQRFQDFKIDFYTLEFGKACVLMLLQIGTIDHYTGCKPDG